MKKRPILKRLVRAAKAFVREVTVEGGVPSGISAIGSYNGAQMGRLFYDWLVSVMAPDDEIRGSARLLRARARDLERNNGLASHYLNLLTSNVIGPTGFRFIAQVRRGKEFDRETNKTLEAGWKAWSEGPVTLDEQFDHVGFQDLLLRTVAVDGEAFVRIHRGVGPFGIALEPVDADLVDDTLNVRKTERGTEIRMGIEVDSLGRRVAYHVIRDPAYSGTIRTHEVIDGKDMIHLYLPRRVNQTRGVTWFTNVMWQMKQEQGYVESELVASRMAACKSIIYMQATNDNGDIVTPTPNEKGEFREDLEPGSNSIAPAGYKPFMVDPTHPTNAFPDFMKSIARRIATGFSVAYNILANDLEGVSFSSIRSWTLSERDIWKKLHGFWRFKWLARITPEWLNGGILTKALDLPRRDWTFYMPFIRQQSRGFDWVDPDSDITASIKAIDRGLTSPQRVIADRGFDPEEILDEIAEWKRMAEEKGVSVFGPAEAAPAQMPMKGAPPMTKPRFARRFDDVHTNGNGASEPALNGHAMSGGV